MWPCPALQEVAGDRELLQREAEESAYAAAETRWAREEACGTGAGKQGQGRKSRAGDIGDWGLGGTWAGKEGQCRRAWAEDMGQWGARAGQEWEGRKSRAGGVGHCGAPEGQGSKVRAEEMGHWGARNGRAG